MKNKDIEKYERKKALKSASERQKERKNNYSNTNFKEIKVPSIVRKFFFYDNEVISGTTYLLRIIFPAFILFISINNFDFLIIPAILLLSYVQSVIAYKRAKSLFVTNSSHLIFAIWGLIVFPIQFFAESKGVSNIFDGMQGFLIVTFPHLILLFRNRRANTESFSKNKKTSKQDKNKKLSRREFIKGSEDES